MENKKHYTRRIVESAMLLAVAIVLEIIAKLFSQCITLSTFIGSVDDCFSFFRGENHGVSHSCAAEFKETVYRYCLRNLIPSGSEDGMIGYCKYLIAQIIVFFYAVSNTLVSITCICVRV